MKFDCQPNLCGDLVTMRSLQADDFTDLYGVAKDPLIWEQHPDRNRFREKEFNIFFQKAVQGRNALVIFDRRKGVMIGSSRFIVDAHNVDVVEIGYTFLSRSYWGGSFNGEVKQLMLNHAFSTFPKVVFNIGRDNIRSCKAIEKLGAMKAKEFLKMNSQGTAIPYLTYELQEEHYQNHVLAVGHIAKS